MSRSLSSAAVVIGALRVNLHFRTIGIGLTSTASRAGSMVAPFSENLVCHSSSLSISLDKQPFKTYGVFNKTTYNS